MKHRCHLQTEVSRSGITRIEVFVILISVAWLLSLFVLPLIQTARGPNRRLQCFNNLRTLALATSAWATSHGGQLPLLSEPAPGLASRINATWMIQLLPYMDNAGAFEYISEQKTPQEAETALNRVLGASYRALQCPLDPRQFTQPGGLSYGANIGYGAWKGTASGVTTAYDFGATDHSAASIDWNGNGKLDPSDKEVARATGVFWSADEDGFRLTLDDIINGDGSGQTILFAETMNLPPIHLAGAAKNGHNPRALDAGIGLGYESLGLKKSQLSSLFLNRSTKASAEYSQYFRPNSNRGTAIGKWPGATSMHKLSDASWAHDRFVNVVFADGHCSAISEDIDWSVWASLHTPQGMQHGQIAISEAEF